VSLLNSVWGGPVIFGGFSFGWQPFVEPYSFLFPLLFARPQNLRLIFIEPHSSERTRRERTFLVSRLTRRL